MSSLLDIQHLKIAHSGKTLLEDVSLRIGAGEVHALMGQNGSGKSTLAQTLAGREDFEVMEGQVSYQGEDLFELSPAERAQRGLFIGFQYPIDLPGVRLMSFLQASLNARRKARGLDALNPADFLRVVREKASELNMDETMLRREVNVGFSGGERKRFEALQMILLEPELAILDEIDSGLDVDALQWVARAANQRREQGGSILLITHYARLLDLIIPDHVHILRKGCIDESGGRALADEIEQSGFRSLEKESVRARALS